MKTKFIYIYFLFTWLYPNSSFKIFTACFSEKPDTYKYIVKGLSVLSLLITCTQIYILLSHYIYNLFIYLFIYYLFFNSFFHLFFHLFLSSKYKHKHEFACVPSTVWNSFPFSSSCTTLADDSRVWYWLKKNKNIKVKYPYSEIGNIHWLFLSFKWYHKFKKLKNHIFPA